jgi:1,4-dihydroxy-6-naphthoate synthase
VAVTLSLGISPCPNDTFVFHAWAHRLVLGPEVDAPTFADIDVLNDLAAGGNLDIVKVSYGALPYLLDDYVPLASGGAIGRGCGPLVLSRNLMEPAALRDSTIAVPGDRTTAYLLLRLWLGQIDQRQIVVLPFDEIMPAVRDGSVDAGLVIHESRFTYPSYGLRAVVDLGEWWERDTGLAIPLGAIVARRELGAEAIAAADGAIRASVRYAFEHRDASRHWVMTHAQEMDPVVVDQHIALYVNEFTVDLGDEGRAAVDALLGRARAAQLVPA